VIPIIVLAVFAVLFFCFLVYQGWRQGISIEPAAHADQLRPVDLAAFRNLTDPEEERFLRANLSSREFTKIQRLRLRAAAKYVSALSENASKLIAIGQTARFHPNEGIAVSGQEILNHAVRLKLWCLATRCKLNITMIWPTLFSPSGKIADRYLYVASLATELPRKMAA
jgi:hypothetical protein